MDRLKIFYGRANLDLAKEITDKTGIVLGDISISNFQDGEINVKINENVRGKDCFILQPTSPPVNENLMELLIIIDAFKRASAKRITAVIPYFGYGRQDRKVEPRVPITAKLVADLLAISGANRVLSVDLHAGQLQGFFNIPVDNLIAMPVMVKYFKEKKIQNLVVISPDSGGVERAREVAKKLQVGLAIIDKRRTAPNKSSVMNIIGDVKGKNALIVDDIVDTAGTLVNVAEAIKEKGVKNVYVSIVHGVLSGNAIEKINNSFIDELIITNTVENSQKIEKSKKIKILSIAELLKEAIIRIHKEESISSLFN